MRSACPQDYVFELRRGTAKTGLFPVFSREFEKIINIFKYIADGQFDEGKLLRA